MSNTIDRRPGRFVGLHAHSGFSIYDGMSLPQAHIDYVLSNEMDAWALTDHGNANGHMHAFTKARDLQKAGRQFKFIPGCEMYLHPDLEMWRREHALSRQRTSEPDDDEASGATVEDEQETKRVKWNDPIKRRHHLVVLAKSRKGLENLYTLITRSYDEGLYRFPRIDYAMLKEHGEDLIISSACIGGNLAADVLMGYDGIEWDNLLPSMSNAIRTAEIDVRLDASLDRMIDCVGRDNVFIELQFNRLPAQLLVNKHLISLSRRSGIPMLITADSHYPRPDMWKDRELYKKLGWLNSDKYEKGMLPNSVDELKAELYPKNASQVWDSYLDSRACFPDEDYSFYDDDELIDAIERTYDVAHDICDVTTPSKEYVFTNKVVPKGIDNPFDALVNLVKVGLVEKGFAEDQAYIDRALEELEVIRDKGFSMYFLTMAKIMDIANANMLTGPGRGCFVPETEVMTPHGSKRIDEFNTGDHVIDAYGESGEVIETFTYDIDEMILELEFDDGIVVKCTNDHKFLVRERGWVKACDLSATDEIVDL